MGRRFLLCHTSQDSAVKSCWQIRQDHPADGEQWRISCTECHAFATGTSCWELETPCCCAPVHVSCDFCALYIDHRHEIANHQMRNHQGTQSGERHLAFRPQGQACFIRKEDSPSLMEKIQLNVPEMYADHHVLKVRDALSALAPGVQSVVASSAFRIVSVEYDPSVVSADAIQSALASAGYPVSSGPATVNPVVPAAPGATKRFDPAWERLGVRISRTDARDAKSAR
jgi:copper chaperone CopZ